MNDTKKPWGVRVHTGGNVFDHAGWAHEEGSRGSLYVGPSRPDAPLIFEVRKVYAAGVWQSAEVLMEDPAIPLPASASATEPPRH